MALIEKDIITISSLLQRPNLQIPSFQRPYKWGIHNVIQLIEDIKRFSNKEEYRIGTIVLYKEEDSSKNISLNLVDGQQRTITFMLMIKSIIELEIQLPEHTKALLSKINKAGFNPEFSSVISQGNIRRNYLEISRRLNTLSKEQIYFFLTKCHVNIFVIDDISEAFQFFDSQNARGKDLEPHDLLKAFHLRELELISGTEEEKEEEIKRLVASWENIKTEELASLFADFLYRVRGWSKGNSSRYFRKKDTPLFKGITLGKIDDYPYVERYKLIDKQIHESIYEKEKLSFPFQLDQTIINGKYFFEMISHYKIISDEFNEKNNNEQNLDTEALHIMNTLNSYSGKSRKGDEYARMLFNCALIYYVDKFGRIDISEAIKKIFIWAYTIRLNRQNLQLAALDNYVVKEYNLFKKMRSAFHHQEILSLELPLLDHNREHRSDKTAEIRTLFTNMKYATNEG